MQADPHHERVRVVALAEQQLELVREDRHELHLRDDDDDDDAFRNTVLLISNLKKIK